MVGIDTRDPDVYAKGHLPGAVNLREIFTYMATSDPDGLASMKERFVEAFGAAGLTGKETAVLYEDAMNTGFGQSCRGSPKPQQACLASREGWQQAVCAGYRLIRGVRPQGVACAPPPSTSLRVRQPASALQPVRRGWYRSSSRRRPARCAALVRLQNRQMRHADYGAVHRVSGPSGEACRGCAGNC